MSPETLKIIYFKTYSKPVPIWALFWSYNKIKAYYDKLLDKNFVKYGN